MKGILRGYDSAKCAHVMEAKPYTPGVVTPAQADLHFETAGVRIDLPTKFVLEVEEEGGYVRVLLRTPGAKDSALLYALPTE